MLVNLRNHELIKVQVCENIRDMKEGKKLHSSAMLLRNKELVKDSICENTRDMKEGQKVHTKLSISYLSKFSQEL